MSTTIGDFVVRLVMQDEDFDEGARNAKRTLDGLGRSLSGFADLLGGLFVTAVGAATAAMGAFAASSVEVGSGFEASITKVGVLAGGVDGAAAAIDALGEEARRLGATTAYSGQQAADAMQTLASAGLKTNEIIAATNSALLLAGASGSTLDDATSILVSTMSQFGLAATDAGRISDVFAQAMNVSTLDMTSLTEAMKYAGTIGRSFGYSLEQTTAAVALFRDLGLEGSKAGTAFRNALAQATTVSTKGEQALARYGLTVADINPETQNFAELMTRLGHANMTTTDLIAVFGQEAAGSIAVLSRGFADGTTKFDEYLTSFEQAGGTTASVYAAMTDTVEGRVAQVSSALEELQLVLFDTYGPPLRDLLDEVASLVGYVAASFSRASGEIGSGFAEQVRSLVSYLQQNRQAIALGFQQLVASTVALGEALVRIVPILDDLLVLMGAVFLANRVRIFVSAIVQATGAISTLGGGLRALYAAVVAMSGGTLALVAAIGTLVVAIGAYVIAQNSAEAAAERLRAAEERLAAERAEREKVEIANANELAAAQARRLGAFGLELQQRGQLTNAIDGQLSALAGLSDEQIRAGLAEGRLFEATIAGERVVLDNATALELATSGAQGYEDALAGLEAAQRRNIGEQRAAETSLARLDEALARYEATTSNGMSGTAAFRVYLERYGATVEEVEARQRALREEVAATTSRVEVFANEALLAEQALTKKAIASGAAATGIQAEGEETGKATKAAEDYASKLRSATEARIALSRRVAEEALRASGDETAVILADLARREEEVRRVYEAEIALVRRKAAEVVRLNRAMEADLASIRATAQAKQRTETERLVAAVEQELRSLRLTDEQEEQVATDDRLDALAEAFTREAALYEEGSEGRLAVNRRFLAALALVEATEAEKRRAAQVAAEREGVRVLAGLYAEQTGRIARFEAERARILDEIAGASADTRALIEAEYGRRVQAERERISDEVRVLTGRETDEIAALEDRAASSRSARQRDRLREQAETLRRIDALERERAAKLVDYADASEEERASIVETYSRQIEDVQRESDERTRERTVETIEQIRRAAVAVVSEVARAAGAAVGAVVSGLGDLFASLTGGLDLSLTSVTSSVLDEVAAEREALAAQLKEGAISPEQYEAGLAALDPTQAARDFVSGLLAEASTFAATLAAAAPGFIEALVEGIPSLVDGLVAAIPAVVEALASGLPALVDVLVDAIPRFVAAVVEALPVLVDALVTLLVEGLPALLAQLGPIVEALVEALVEAVPVVVQAIADALPSVVAFVVDAVEALLAALPEIISGILAALPSILTTLLAGVGDLVVAVLDAIPSIVGAIVDNLPAILMALLRGVLDIVVQVVAALPSLVAGIVDLLPTLIPALLLLVVDLIVAVLDAIPQIIEGFLLALPRLITSVIRAIPAIILGIVDALPRLLTALVVGIVSLVPEIIVAVVKALPAIVIALVEGLIEAVPALLRAIFIDLPMMLGQAIVTAIREGLATLGRFFKDVFREIVTLGKADTATFGDTPGPVRAGGDGLLASFAPGDYVVAAQRPVDVLRQALAATGADLSGVFGGGEPPPASPPVVVGGAGAAAPIDIAIMAEGRLLDAVQVTALDRGHAPRLDQRLRRASGVRVGVDRGRFNPYSST